MRWQTFSCPANSEKMRRAQRDIESGRRSFESGGDEIGLGHGVARNSRERAPPIGEWSHAAMAAPPFTLASGRPEMTCAASRLRACRLPIRSSRIGSRQDRALVRLLSASRIRRPRAASICSCSASSIPSTQSSSTILRSSSMASARCGGRDRRQHVPLGGHRRHCHFLAQLTVEPVVRPWNSAWPAAPVVVGEWARPLMSASSSSPPSHQSGMRSAKAFRVRENPRGTGLILLIKKRRTLHAMGKWGVEGGQSLKFKVSPGAIRPVGVARAILNFEP